MTRTRVVFIVLLAVVLIVVGVSYLCNAPAASSCPLRRKS
jgi:hypothetical protein